MRLNPFDEEKILLRFGVLSDCHLGRDPARTMKSCKSFCAPFSIWRAQRPRLAVPPDEARAGRGSGKADFRLWPLPPAGYLLRQLSGETVGNL